MRISIDVRPMLEEQRSGVANYTANLVDSLCRRHTHDYTLFCNTSRYPFPKDLPEENDHVQHAFSRYPNRLLNTGFRSRMLKMERLTGKADAVFLPNLNFVSTKLPLVTTIHDLSFERYPQFFSAKQRAWHTSITPTKLLKKSSAIIAVSEHTKIDIVELYGIDEDKIHVVYPAAQQDFTREESEKVAFFRARNSLPKDYFLSLGTLEPRKNIIAVIRAFEALPSHAHLVIAGGYGWRNKEMYKLLRTSSCRERITFLGYIPENEKALLYSGALALVYPSFYEGFGIPPLEAMTCGTPVIASHTSSLGEVVGNAGLLIDPYKPSELADAMLSLLNDKTLREKMSAEGLLQVDLFTWDKSASRLEHVFNSL